VRRSAESLLKKEQTQQRVIALFLLVKKPAYGIATVSFVFS